MKHLVCPSIVCNNTSASSTCSADCFFTLASSQFLFLLDKITGVSIEKPTYILPQQFCCLLSMCTHLLGAGRRREQWHCRHHDGSEPTEQNGEVEVVDAAQHCRRRIHNATSGRRESKLQHHPTHTHHQTHHQAPECTLKAHNTHTGEHIQMTFACLLEVICRSSGCWEPQSISWSSPGSHLGVFGS